MADPDPAGDAPPAVRGGRDLPKAIVVGVGLATGYLGSVVVHPLLFIGFCTIALAIALLELDTALAVSKARPPTAIAIVAVPVTSVGAYLVGADALALGLLAAMGAGFVVVAATQARGHVTARLSALALMLLWVVLPASTLGLLLARDDGHWYVMAATALTVTSDIGAYAFGRNWGRTKMAPSISPSKTWEGFAGALLSTVLLATVVSARIVPGLTVTSAAVLAVATVVASTVGDLSESLVKRDLAIKDLGTILPGHGGLMDRIDALLFALPTAHVVLLAFGL